jgi:MFS family permease
MNSAISLLAQQAYRISTSFFLAEQFDSIAITSVIFFLGILPNIIVTFYSGYIVDTSDKFKVIAIADIGVGLALIILFSILSVATSDYIVLAGFLIAQTAINVSSVFSGPAVFSLLPSIIDKDDLLKGNGLMRTSEKTIEMIGKAFGAILLKIVGILGITLAASLASLFSAAILIYSGLKDEKQEDNLPKNVRSALAEGLKYFRETTGLISFFLFRLTIHFFFTPILLAMPFFVKDHLNSGVELFSAMMISLSLGAIVGHFIAKQLNNTSKIVRDNTLILSVILMSASLIEVSMAQSIYTALIGMFSCGIFNGIFSVNAVTTMQRIILSDFRGRVSALFSFAIGLVMALSFAFTPLLHYLLSGDSKLTMFVSAFFMVVGTIFFSLSRNFRTILVSAN